MNPGHDHPKELPGSSPRNDPSESQAVSPQPPPPTQSSHSTNLVFLVILLLFIGRNLPWHLDDFD
ncbi:MAG: hypothetical protein V4710_19870, partial [Verrucomicrobiota bacterium]